MIPIKLFLKMSFFVYIKMDQENIMFMGNWDNSYTMVDLYQNNRFIGYKDSYNYYDIDADKIFLFKNNSDKYIIRYHDVNKMELLPLQLKIRSSYGEFANSNIVMFIHNDDDKNVEKYGIRLLN